MMIVKSGLSRDKNRETDKKLMHDLVQRYTDNKVGRYAGLVILEYFIQYHVDIVYLALNTAATATDKPTVSINVNTVKNKIKNK